MWIEIVVSAGLTITVTVSGWMFSRIVSRIDKIEQRVIAMSERDSTQDARLVAIEKQTLTKDDLREVMDAALDKATAPITRELEAIKINSSQTRERLIKLEATYEASQ